MFGLGTCPVALAMSEPGLPPIDSLWDFGDPKGSEGRFREAWTAAQTSGDTAYKAELLTQLARAQGLQLKFDEAHALLDSAKSLLPAAGPRARVRYLLERGRTWNSSGSKDRACELFMEAWEQASDHALCGLAVDAAHMVAIAKPEEALEWNLRALEVALQSDDPDAQRWRGSLYNNLGWTCFERKQYDSALAYFEEALTCRIEQGKPADVQVARWCVAKCRRVLGQLEAALALQLLLERDTQAAGAPDGFVMEEIAECLWSLGRTEEARPYFAKAYELLSQDPWLSRDEPERLARLLNLSR